MLHKLFNHCQGEVPFKLTVRDYAHRCIRDKLSREQAKKEMKANDKADFLHTIQHESGHPAANVVTKLEQNKKSSMNQIIKKKLSRFVQCRPNVEPKPSQGLSLL